MNNFEILKEEITECRIRANSDETIKVLNYLQHFAQNTLNNGWIATDDKSLKQYANKEVLIYADFGIKIAIYTVDNSTCFDDDGVEYGFSHWFSDKHGDFAWELDEVCYWQPLPQPPKE